MTRTGKIKIAFAANWAAFALAFAICEFAGWNWHHWELVVAFTAWFLIVELWQAIAGALAKNGGGTLSESVWHFQAEGYHIQIAALRIPARLFPAWALTTALCLRLAAAARTWDAGYDADSAAYWQTHLPLDMMLAGVAVWLVFHFASGGQYEERGA